MAYCAISLHQGPRTGVSAGRSARLLLNSTGTASIQWSSRGGFPQAARPHAPKPMAALVRGAFSARVFKPCSRAASKALRWRLSSAAAPAATEALVIVCIGFALGLVQRGRTCRNRSACYNLHNQIEHSQGLNFCACRPAVPERALGELASPFQQL